MFDDLSDRTAPHRTRIKFCGMTRIEDAVLAAALGVDAVGLIFAERSKRRLSLDRAVAILAALPPFVTGVALCMDNPADEVRAIVEGLRPSLLQFHGDEDDAFCAGFGLPYMKAVAMGGDADDSENLRTLAARWPRARAFLFDGHAKGEAGGGGRRFDWARVPASFDRPILLAGGLGPDNVFEAIAATRCWGVDVSSGIEDGIPGIKSTERMRRFVTEVARADAAIRGA